MTEPATGTAIADAFLDALAAAPGGTRFATPDATARAALGAALARLHAEAAEVWPTLGLEVITYARHVATSIAANPDPAPFEAIFERLHTGDLYLACAAGTGVANASQLFVHEFLAPIGAAVMSIHNDPAFVDDVRQALHERLLLAVDGPPRILQYAGRASLASWVGVAAQRLALGLLRSEGAYARASDRAADEPLPVVLDPELAYLKERYRPAFKEALSAAIARLPQRQRMVIRLHTVSGLKMQRIAEMLDVDESTVSRWIQGARAQILGDTERELGVRLGVRVTEVPSVARLVTSQLDVSLARLLGGEDPSAIATVKGSG